MPPGIHKVMDSASCPIVAGVPEVLKAAFTKEVDFFATRNIKYVDPALTFTEPGFLRKQLFDCFGPLLEVTEDESDYAVEQAHKAMTKFAADPAHYLTGAHKEKSPPVPAGTQYTCPMHDLAQVFFRHRHGRFRHHQMQVGEPVNLFGLTTRMISDDPRRLRRLFAAQRTDLGRVGAE